MYFYLRNRKKTNKIEQMMNPNNRYSTGRIYMITHPNTDKKYIGSTTQLLSKRKHDHISLFLNYGKDTGKYTSSIEICRYGIEDVEIILIENYPCDSREELHARERFHIENTENCVNIKIPTRSRKEYNELFPEKNIQRRKAYWEKNKDLIRSQNSQYQKDNKEKILITKQREYICDCGVSIQTCNKARHLRTKKHQAFLKCAPIIILED